ncbi:MAG TPA: flavodoxin domain-containing protein [Dongiaceae bacterium]|nr:flavodoxin domain-containing protein [Dongiaceae bacterium]
MRVLIVYASRYGGTQGIAERVGAVLRQHSLEVVVESVEQASDPADYDAVVIGSAAYYFRWMKKATDFVRRNRSALAERPVWLFSSGPLGTKTVDEQGRDVCEVTVPKEVAEFKESIHPRGHRVFFGALIREKLGFAHRLMLKLPVNRDNAVFPLGDFRDWKAIELWASEIAGELKASELKAELPTLQTATP